MLSSLDAALGGSSGPRAASFKPKLKPRARKGEAAATPDPKEQVDAAAAPESEGGASEARAAEKPALAASAALLPAGATVFSGQAGTAAANPPSAQWSLRSHDGGRGADQSAPQVEAKQKRSGRAPSGHDAKKGKGAQLASAPSAGSARAVAGAAAAPSAAAASTAEPQPHGHVPSSAGRQATAPQSATGEPVQDEDVDIEFVDPGHDAVRELSASTPRPTAGAPSRLEPASADAQLGTQGEARDGVLTQEAGTAAAPEARLAGSMPPPKPVPARRPARQKGGLAGSSAEGAPGRPTGATSLPAVTHTATPDLGGPPAGGPGLLGDYFGQPAQAQPALRAEEQQQEGTRVSKRLKGQDDGVRRATPMAPAGKDPAIQTRSRLKGEHGGNQAAAADAVGMAPGADDTRQMQERPRLPHGTPKPRRRKVPTSIITTREMGSLTLSQIIMRAEALEKMKQLTEQDENEEEEEPDDAELGPRKGKKRKGSSAPQPAEARAPPAPGDALAPQVTIVNGRVVVNEATLSTDARAVDDHAGYRRVDESIPKLNYHTHLKIERAERWSVEETTRWYKALQQFGTDFEMLQCLFPGRSRRQMKAKFKKEERLNPELVNYALRNRPTEADHKHYEAALGAINPSLKDNAAQVVQDSARGPTPGSTPMSTEVNEESTEVNEESTEVSGRSSSYVAGDEEGEAELMLGEEALGPGVPEADREEAAVNPPEMPHAGRRQRRARQGAQARTAAVRSGPADLSNGSAPAADPTAAPPTRHRARKGQAAGAGAAAAAAGVAAGGAGSQQEKLPSQEEKLPTQGEEGLTQVGGAGAEGREQRPAEQGGDLENPFEAYEY